MPRATIPKVVQKIQPFKFIITKRPEKKIKEDPIMRKGYTVYVPSIPQDQMIKTKCPECKTDVCYYTNPKRPKTEHHCTVCGSMVTL